MAGRAVGADLAIRARLTVEGRKRLVPLLPASSGR